MCLIKSGKIFHRKVGQDLLKKLEDLAIKNCKKLNEPFISCKNEYEFHFYVYLAKFIKEWGEHMNSIDGTKSPFAIALEKLKGANVDFGVNVGDYNNTAPQRASREEGKSRGMSTIEAQAQNVFAFAAQIDPNMWLDKDMAGQVYSQVNGLFKKVTNELEISEQNPDKDLTSLLDLNMKLSALKELIPKAAKGDKDSALRIANIIASNANCNLNIITKFSN